MPHRPRTYALPAVTAGINDILEFTESTTKYTVSAMVSYQVELAWTFAKDRAQAIDFFNNARSDGHYEYFIYRTPENQYEIPCAGDPGKLYVRAALAPVDVANLVKGFSIAFIRGGERF